MKPITPIRTEQEYDAALAEIDRLWDAKPGTAAADRLEVLATLVEAAYEASRWPIQPPDPIDAILFRIEQQGLTRKDLEPYLGGRGHVSEVLTRKRALSLTMIRRLHAGLGIPLESLVQPTKREKRPRPKSRTKRAA